MTHFQHGVLLGLYLSRCLRKCNMFSLPPLQAVLLPVEANSWPTPCNIHKVLAFQGSISRNISQDEYSAPSTIRWVELLRNVLRHVNSVAGFIVRIAPNEYCVDGPVAAKDLSRLVFQIQSRSPIFLPSQSRLTSLMRVCVVLCQW